MPNDGPEQDRFKTAQRLPGPPESPYSRDQYPPPPQQQGGPPNPSPYGQNAPAQPNSQNDMLTLPPPPSHGPPNNHYGGHEQYGGYQGPPAQPPQHYQHPPPPHQHAPHPHIQQHFAQPAPRQRTAIACRYCRRRKIRCHGFDTSPDGRCTNCIRFHQECIFTPVSSQAHAFVPAHTAYPQLRGGRGMPPADPHAYPHGQPMIYSAHGQPLGSVPHQGHESNYPPPPSQSYAPPPYPAQAYDERNSPHGQDQSRMGGAPRRSSEASYTYPDPSQAGPTSPASAPGPYSAGPYPSSSYYPPQQQQNQGAARRSPPQAQPYHAPYDQRSSGSPHAAPSGPPPPPQSSGGYPYPGGLHPPQVLPPAFDAGRTPPPPPPPQQAGGQSSPPTANGTAAPSGGGSSSSATTNGTRSSMSVRDMLSPGDGQGTRSSADNQMLNQLNRRGM